MQRIRAYFYPIRDFNLDLLLIVAYPSADFYGEVRRTEKIVIGVGSAGFLIALIVGVSILKVIQ